MHSYYLDCLQILNNLNITIFIIIIVIIIMLMSVNNYEVNNQRINQVPD